MATEGGRCPRCDVALDTHDVAGQSVGLCPGCGGAWVAAGALTEIDLAQVVVPLFIGGFLGMQTGL